MKFKYLSIIILSMSSILIADLYDDNEPLIFMHGYPRYPSGSDDTRLSQRCNSNSECGPGRTCGALGNCY